MRCWTLQKSCARSSDCRPRRESRSEQGEIVMNLRDQMRARFAQLQQEQQARDAAALETARTQPIPGMTGPTNSGAGILPGGGMAPPRQQIPTPGVPSNLPPSVFMHSGPYGQQAQQLAGLLGGPRPSSIGSVNSIRDAIINSRQGGGLLGAPNAGNHMMQPGAMQYGTTMAPHHLALLGAPATQQAAAISMRNARRPSSTLPRHQG
jgi:hypothetical protein